MLILGVSRLHNVGPIAMSEGRKTEDAPGPKQHPGAGVHVLRLPHRVKRVATYAPGPSGRRDGLLDAGSARMGPVGGVYIQAL